MFISRIFIFLSSFCLFSQLQAKPTVVVTLSSLGDRIHAQNPDLAAARLRIREAMGNANQAGRYENPTLDATVSHNQTFQERTLEIGFSQRFPVTNRLKLEKKLSLLEIKTAEAEVREVERQLISKARELGVKALALRQQRALLQEQVKVSQEFANFLSDAVAKGEGSALDAGQAKLEAASLAVEIRQMDAEEIALLGELKPLLDISPQSDLLVSGTLPAASLPPAANNISHRPDYQASRIQTQSAAKAEEIERAKRYDDVEGGIFAGAERKEDAPEGYRTEAIIGLRFKVTLPFWNKNEGKIQAAESRKERAKKETVALAKNIKLETSNARTEMQQWIITIREIDQTLFPLANEQAKFALESYRNGQGEIQSVLRSREKRLQLAAAKLNALREFHLARVRYESALGKP